LQPGTPLEVRWRDGVIEIEPQPLPVERKGGCLSRGARRSSRRFARIEANFVKPATVVALGAATYRTLLRRLANHRIGGGRTYDAVIGECARHARADTVLTFNRGHFDPPPRRLAVIDPAILR
jgi:hypothetical protein